jgi:AcrR family transcriptional regulator
VPSANTRQQIAAAETQRAIVKAAAGLFFDRGYRGTSITQIAAEAGVAVQTIYNSIGSKSELLSRVLDFAGPGEGVPHAEGGEDPHRIIELLVEFWRGAVPRTAPVFRVIREASAVDSEVAALERDRAAQRLANYETPARLLEDRGALRPGLTVRRAAATIFAIGHPDVYRALVLEGGWDDTLWVTWVRSALKAALLS